LERGPEVATSEPARLLEAAEPFGAIATSSQIHAECRLPDSRRTRG
jgi:hypothetical protein